MRVFGYMKKSNFAKLSPERQKFMSKMIIKEVGKIAEEKNISRKWRMSCMRKDCLAETGSWMKINGRV